MEGVDRLLPQLREASRVPCGCAFGGELLVLTDARVRRTQLLELPAHVLLLALTPRPQLL